MGALKTLTIEALAARIAAAARPSRRPVFIQGGPGEPMALRECWRSQPALMAGLRLCALFMPGVNRVDYTNLAPGVSIDLFLPTPDYAEAIATGRARAFPIHYSAIPQCIRASRPSVAVLNVAPPDGQGRCSLGLCADAGVAAARAADAVYGLINNAMPSIKNAPYWRLEQFEAVTEVDCPLAELTPSSPEAATAIAAHMQSLVLDGACLQVGIGKLPSAILAALDQKQDLRFHGGLVSPGHLRLTQAGCVQDRPGAITAGIALGDNGFYKAIASDPRLKMAPIETTHGLASLAEIAKFTAINAALEIDLYGQVNAEWAGARSVAGIGGLGDFVRGAMASDGGRAIIMLQASGANGVSRVRPRLDSPTITLSRADADVFVTEHGVADVRGLSIEDRAVAIANIAAPEHRTALLAQWRRS